MTAVETITAGIEDRRHVIRERIAALTKHITEHHDTHKAYKLERHIQDNRDGTADVSHDIDCTASLPDGEHAMDEILEALDDAAPAIAAGVIENDVTGWTPTDKPDGTIAGSPTITIRGGRLWLSFAVTVSADFVAVT